MPDDYYVSQYSGEEIDERLTAAHNAVRYDAAQTLTDAQKTQARANIAAAPDGFGLGANGYPKPYTVVTGATIDALNESGLFWYRDADTPIYPDDWNSGTTGNLLHIQGATNNTAAARQIFYPYHPYERVALNISCMRMKTHSDTWQPWEWVNPPMTLGVEFRTTERYLGKPVYVKTVQAFESLTGSDAVDLCEVPVDNADKCISCTGETSTNWSLPSDVIEGGSSHIYIGAQVDVNVIKIWAKTDRSSWSQAIRVTIKYTKTTE